MNTIPFTYEIIRSPRRKTACISVGPNCSVRVLVPSFLQEEQIEELVQRKSSWIKGKIAHFQKIRQNSRAKQYVSGACFPYLGRNYRLKVVQGVQDNGQDDPAGQRVKLINGRFYVTLPSGLVQEQREYLIREQLVSWFREHAVVRLQEITARYAQQMTVVPASVGIKSYRSRWGSCHADGRIYYNWRIIAAPRSVVDYVVVHELCHLVHPDHSPRFWRFLATVLPDYAVQKEWLRINGGGLGV
ncbi:MAG: M48 family metallopeptidase [Candidatus Electrothrix sp. YB6]